MLSRIEIRDFALIEKAIIEPAAGLLVITGETGAGKSILIDAIGSLLGGRLNREVVRSGRQSAVVEAVFSDYYEYIPADWLEQLALEEDSDLVLSREISTQGRSICRLNGRMVSQSVLKQTAGYLIDIHGQNDHQTIFNPETHRLLLDRFGGKTVSEAMESWQKQRIECLDLKSSLAELGKDPAERARQLDLLTFQINEISAAALKPNEEEKLVKRKKLLSSLGKIQENLAGALDLLSGDSTEGVPAKLAEAFEYLEFPSRYLESVRQCKNGLNSIIDQISIYSSDLREAMEKYQAQPGELEKTDERLDLIYRLKKKYGGTIESVLEYLDKAMSRQIILAKGEERFEQLSKLLEASITRLSQLGILLSEARAQAAAVLKQKITKQLNDLGMKNVEFDIKIDTIVPTADNLSLTDPSIVNFLFSANPGEPVKPLARIASGGEASRVLLAVKSILAEYDNIPVLIFDEIDTGVSGYTAGMVADKLCQIADVRQVFCITHMAQIAAKANQHILIEKTSDNKSTMTSLYVLDRESRLTELSRLLSGGIADDKARELAQQMLR